MDPVQKKNNLKTSSEEPKELTSPVSPPADLGDALSVPPKSDLLTNSLPPVEELGQKNEPIIIKEQFGRADIKFKNEYKTVNGKQVKVITDDCLDYGDDCKAAATDALKKCASELGIASDIYGANEFKEVGLDKDVLVKPNSTVNPPKPPAPATKGKVSAYLQLKGKLFELGAKTMAQAIAKYKNN